MSRPQHTLGSFRIVDGAALRTAGFEGSCFGHCILSALRLVGPLSSELLFDEMKLQLRSANHSPVTLSSIIAALP